jgi:DNA ligase-1
MQTFAEACDKVNATPKRLEKIALIADYLRTLDEANLDAATRFFQGRLLPPREPKVAIGHRSIMDAGTRILHLKADEVRTAYRESGELGEALAALYRPPLDFGFGRETLTPATVRDRLHAAARLRGSLAGTKRVQIVEKLFADCSSAREVAVICKILTGELRIGLREGLILEAIAQAFACAPQEVRRAAIADADFGVLARAAKNGTLDGIEPAYGLPISPMLASPLLFGSTYTELANGGWIAEDKFDGIRAQLHCDQNKTHLFSRTGNSIEANFPEILSEARGYFDQSVIIDGEIIASRDGRALPFAVLQPRIARKQPDSSLQESIPVVFVAFDLLAQGTEMLLDLPWHERRERLSALFSLPAEAHLQLADASPINGTDAAALEILFERARADGNEGLMLKQTASPYTSGRRGKQWLKLKRELATLDVVVLAVEWGHGKRADMLSDYTFAVRGKNDTLVTIGKAYSGLTDQEIRVLTEHFKAAMTGKHVGKRALAVTPDVVLEIAFDVIMKSDLHEGGYTLRFPRIVRVREDKTPAEISTIIEVEEIYQSLEPTLGPKIADQTKKHEHIEGDTQISK